MSINIIQPGLLTTVQDYGRYGYQKEGIIVSGAMDKLALRIGNILVGNEEKEAGLEITQMGPSILFQENCLIAITGANLSPSINQRTVPLWRPVYMNRGSLLEFGKPLHGYRAYITFAGGLSVPEVIGSRSTYLRAKIGGWYGRALQMGDNILFKRPQIKSFAGYNSSQVENKFVPSKWSISPTLQPVYGENPVIRIMEGSEYEMFTEDSKRHLWNSLYTITHQSDRMGYRLKGNTLSLNTTNELISSAVTFGTIQVPSSGHPIILMADHQTTGGYARIGQVASVDLSKLAQALPGNSIHFKRISLKDAQQLYIIQEKNIRLLKRSVSFKAFNSLLQ